MVNPEDFIKDQIPRSQWPVIPTICRQAYAAAADLAKDQPILEVTSAKDNRGRLISWAVDFGFERAVKSGAIPCDYKWSDFALPTGRYLELRFSHSTASVSQVSDPRRQPRNVVFRENARLHTQGVFDLEELKEEQRIHGLPHFLIIHGHQELNFVHLGVPCANSKTKWAWRSANLMRIPHAVPDDRPPPEVTDTDFEEVNLLKEDIEKWIRDNDVLK